MISGTVNARREAVLTLTIMSGDIEHTCDSVVDTGFDGSLSLPPDFIALLGLGRQGFGRALLADGSEAVFNIYEAIVLWDDAPRTIPVYEMDSEPLVGMSLMYGYELVLPILDGAIFTLRSIAIS
jgi:predicted aspartyl protease